LLNTIDSSAATQTIKEKYFRNTKDIDKALQRASHRFQDENKQISGGLFGRKKNNEYEVNNEEEQEDNNKNRNNSSSGGEFNLSL
jgi:hypothetical protein